MAFSSIFLVSAAKPTTTLGLFLCIDILCKMSGLFSNCNLGTEVSFFILFI